MKFNNQTVATFQILLKIILTNTILLLALLSVHEFGHLIVGILTGCSSAKIVLFDTEREGPYTELFCNSPNSLTYLGSVFSSLAFASFFLFLKEPEDKRLFFIVVGLSLMFASLDIATLTSSQFSFYISMISGFSFTIFGEYSLTLSYIKKEELIRSYF
ncbi:MAG: hypothetical protein ACP5O8_01345 [Candidatus Aenigmatarchaeota archaeon]